jgi:hypothetical protein
MRAKGKIILAVVLIVAIVILVYWVYFRNPYTNVVVGEMQTVTVRVNGVDYIFTKGGNDLAIYPWDESHNPKNMIYSLQEGQTYQWLGIEITVVEVHVDRFVLSIRPRE